mmetsp:Transcript_10115/g.31194  ORF Transcript_10115/g.31194 Transcript_10115/m.31194 type:complete len:94 (+) Transcript_10115:1409-1690(+)
MRRGEVCSRDGVRGHATQPSDRDGETEAASQDRASPPAGADRWWLACVCGLAQASLGAATRASQTCSPQLNFLGSPRRLRTSERSLITKRAHR